MTFNIKKDMSSFDKKELYREVEVQAKALLASETDAIANAANLSALLFHTLPNLNWAGFYCPKPLVKTMHFSARL